MPVLQCSHATCTARRRTEQRLRREMRAEKGQGRCVYTKLGGRNVLLGSPLSVLHVLPDPSVMVAGGEGSGRSPWHNVLCRTSHRHAFFCQHEVLVVYAIPSIHQARLSCRMQAAKLPRLSRHFSLCLTQAAHAKPAASCPRPQWIPLKCTAAVCLSKN